MQRVWRRCGQCDQLEVDMHLAGSELFASEKASDAIHGSLRAELLEAAFNLEGYKLQRHCSPPSAHCPTHRPAPSASLCDMDRSHKVVLAWNAVHSSTRTKC
eukprot:894953-Rhodomonas_salina.1